MSKFVLTDTGPLFDALLDKAGIDKTYCRRIVLDLTVGSAGMLYLEMFADSEILTLDLSQGFQIQMHERRRNGEDSQPTKGMESS